MTELTNKNPYPPPTALYSDLLHDPNLFTEKLQSFHDSFGTKLKIPTIGGKPLDLHHLFVEVTSRGGIEKVIIDRKWKEVVMSFKFRETITSASFMVRKYYLSLLYHFEQAYYLCKQVPPSTPDAMSENLANSSTTNREGAAINDSPVQVNPVQTLGSLVRGTVDGKFDGGYIVTVDLGSEQLKGVLYHVPSNASPSSYTEGTPISRKRKKSRLALSDPYRPKSNRNGYNFFFAENYARLKPSFYGQEGAINKKIGVMWRNLTDAERQMKGRKRE
ncbi:unnamed protein product [Trifolium pratense]|uniref:Uncharacterized protein n=1 Tax=Trifolium pratense TaxID=57577 RepID=A0ACB0J5F5_TRIPR|nr:unnamed protein product [Trifolium pratense]